MANVLRAQTSDGVVLAPVASATVIEIGDMVAIQSGLAVPASDLTDQGSEALNQAAFRPVFLGVARDQSRNGDTFDIAVDTGLDVNFTMGAVSATYNVGDKLTVKEAASGTALENQVLVVTATLADVTFVCTRREATATTTIKARMVSNLIHPQQVS